MKNREKMVLKTMCFFDIHFLAPFFRFLRFWLDFGRPRRLKKSIKNRKKLNKIAKNRKKVDFETGAVQREGSGRVLGRFWQHFGSIFGAILVDLGRIWHGFWKDFGKIFGRI